MGSTIQTSIAKAADLATDADECQSCHSRIDTKLCPTEVDNYSGYGFAFPACNASTKTTIQGLIEFLIHHHGIPGNIFSDQGPHFTAREVQPMNPRVQPQRSGPMTMESMFPAILKQLGG